MPRIFLSYRREDSRDITDRIGDRLTSRFGRRNVFNFVDAMPGAVHFPVVLDRAIEQADIFVPVIGSGWLDMPGKSGEPRLFEKGDWVRQEIEHALERHIPILPLLVDGASMPPEDRLPASIRTLSFFSARQVRPNPDFDHDMDVVIHDIRRQALRRSNVRRRRWASVAAAVVVCVLLSWAWSQNNKTNDEPPPVIRTIDPSGGIELRQEPGTPSAPQPGGLTEDLVKLPNENPTP